MAGTAVKAATVEVPVVEAPLVEALLVEAPVVVVPVVEVPVVEAAVVVAMVAVAAAAAVTVVKEVPVVTRVVWGTPLHPISNHCKCPDRDLFHSQQDRRCCRHTSRTLCSLAEDRTLESIVCKHRSLRTTGLGQVAS